MKRRLSKLLTSCSFGGEGPRDEIPTLMVCDNSKSLSFKVTEKSPGSFSTSSNSVFMNSSLV